MTFAARRWFAIVLTAVVAVAGSAVLLSRSLSLRDTAWESGWILLAVLLFLSSYNLRKKLTYPPLLSSATWLQLHVYVGILSFILFGWHVGWRIPNGLLETAIAVVYVCVAASGVIGLALSRMIPGRLTVRGEEVLFERIPVYRRQLRERAEAVIVDSAQESGTDTLSDFYARRLAGFFYGPRHAWRHVIQSTRPLTSLMHELRSLERYLSDRERETLRELTELVQAKDSLDYHRTMQGVLKGWLFVHIPLTCVLLVLVGAHVVIVHAFVGAIA